jgi:hypothetical protein
LAAFIELLSAIPADSVFRPARITEKPRIQGPQTAIVVGKAYDLVLWIVQKVEKFPKSYRFRVGQRLIDTALDLLLLLVEAAYGQNRAPRWSCRRTGQTRA